MQAADFSATLQNLFEKGVRYGSVIDLGCADGHFVLNHLSCLGGAVPLNVDANRIYEDPQGDQGCAWRALPHLRDHRP